MNRICLFVIAGVLAGCAHNTDMSPSMSLDGETAVVDNAGAVTVAGIPPAEALGAVDPKKVAETPRVANGGDVTASNTSAATEGNIAVEGAQPSAVLGAIDPKKLIDEKPE